MVRTLLKLAVWLSVPAALVAEAYHAAPAWRFALAGLALLPLARLLGEATDALAAHLGPAWAGLVNATFGNAAELIIAVLALRRGLVEVVQASLTGSIIGNILLVLGLALLAGGLRYPVQKFSALAAESHGASLALGVSGLLLPALFFHLVRPSHREHLLMPLSLSVAAVLLAVYVAGLYFSLRTHRDLMGTHHQQAHGWSKGKAAGYLLLAGTLTGLVAEVLVGSVEPVGQALGLSPVFMGVVVVAVLGNAAEHSAAILLAWRNQMDAAISICFASSLQVALFVTPVLVFASVALGHPMSLVFSAVEVVAVALAVGLAGFVTLNGESNWLEGAQLLALYLILALCLALLPAQEALQPL